MVIREGGRCSEEGGMLLCVLLSIGILCAR